jgi:hypothetical protein
LYNDEIDNQRLYCPIRSSPNHGGQRAAVFPVTTVPAISEV